MHTHQNFQSLLLKEREILYHAHVLMAVEGMGMYCSAVCIAQMDRHRFLRSAYLMSLIKKWKKS
jgi:hypothetical protein